MEGAGATRSIEPAVRCAVALAILLVCSTAGVAGAQVSSRGDLREAPAKAGSYRVTIQGFSWRAYGAGGG